MLPKEEGPGVDPCPERCQGRYGASLKAVLYRIASTENIPGRMLSRRLVVCMLDPSRTVKGEMESNKRPWWWILRGSGRAEDRLKSPHQGQGTCQARKLSCAKQFPEPQTEVRLFTRTPHTTCRPNRHSTRWLKAQSRSPSPLRRPGSLSPLQSRRRLR